MKTKNENKSWSFSGTIKLDENGKPQVYTNEGMKVDIEGSRALNKPMSKPLVSRNMKLMIDGEQLTFYRYYINGVEHTIAGKAGETEIEINGVKYPLILCPDGIPFRLKT